MASPRERSAATAGPRAGCRGRAPRATSGVGEAELPGRDLLAADDPVVGPAEDEGAGNTRLVDHIELRLEGVCLLRLAADACCCGRQLDPELTHQQWQVADGNGEVPQVAREGGGVAQEDVGGDQVEARDLQVLGARVRAVTDQQVVVDGVQLVDQAAQRPLDRGGSVQAHQVGGDLVADADREHLEAPGEPLRRLFDRREAGIEHLAVDPAAGAGHGAPVAVVQAGMHDEVQLGGGVEQVDGRQGVGADGIEAERGHRGEVMAQRCRLGELGAIRPRGETAVGDAAGPEWAAATQQMPAVGARAAPRGVVVTARGQCGRDAGDGLPWRGDAEVSRQQPGERRGGQRRSLDETVSDWSGCRSRQWHQHERSAACTSGFGLLA